MDEYLAAVKRSMPRAAACLLVAGCLLPPPALIAQGIPPETAAESARWARTTSHTEMVEFIDQVQALTDRVLVREIGRSGEGRQILAVFLGDPVFAAPQAFLRSDKPTVLITGLMHGDEPSGREAALVIIRELAVGELSALLESVNVIVVPSVNPDGGAAGRRENASGFDLNRDWVAAETPEVGALLDELVTRYWPDVFLDVHNGGSPPYQLTFQTTLEPAADPDLVAYARGPAFDHVEAALADQGMSAYWYSGPAFDDLTDTWYWRTTEPWPRKHHSYGGLRDMIAVLYEVPESQPTGLAVAAARAGIEALLGFVAENAEAVRAVVDAARRRTVEAPPEEVSLELEPRPYPNPELFYVVAPGPDGGPPSTRLVEGENRTRYVPTRTRPSPWGYLLDADLTGAVALLRRHGLQVERLEEPALVEVEHYLLREAFVEDARYQGHRMLHVRVETEEARMDLETGTYLVRVGQPGGRLIPQLLEPDAVDSLVRWNFLDEQIPPPGEPDSVLPIYRVMGNPGVPTRIVP